MKKDRGIYVKEHAEALKKQVGKSYRPSNGTEGMMFMARYCEQCVKDSRGYAPDGCEIILLSMVCDTDDPDYPEEWVIGKDGQPTCTAFEKGHILKKWKDYYKDKENE